MVWDVSTKIGPLEDVIVTLYSVGEKYTFDRVNAPYKGWELIVNTFRSEIFPIKSTRGKRLLSDLATRLKILTPKQIFQKLPIALAQVKSGNTSENLLIRQFMYFCYGAKEITKKVHNNIMNQWRYNTKMNTFLMNSKSSKTSDPHRLLRKLTNKINLKRSDKYVALSNLSIHSSWKI